MTSSANAGVTAANMYVRMKATNPNGRFKTMIGGSNCLKKSFIILMECVQLMQLMQFIKVMHAIVAKMERGNPRPTKSSETIS